MWEAIFINVHLARMEAEAKEQERQIDLAATAGMNPLEVIDYYLQKGERRKKAEQERQEREAKAEQERYNNLPFTEKARIEADERLKLALGGMYDELKPTK